MINLLLSIKNFFFLSGQSLASLLKVFLMSKPAGKLPSPVHKEAVVLGNGPSLENFLKEKKEFCENKDLWAVNHFVNTKEYTGLKPRYYLINVPEFWKEDIDEDYRQKRQKIFEDFARKTTWDIHLFLDGGARKARFWKKIIKNNSHIHVHFFNSTPIEGFEKFRFFCYARSCGMPRPHNVLIPVLITAVNMGYEKIYITGADHNWMQELFVGEDNTVYLTQKHFYDARTAVPAVMKKEGKGQRKMHEILTKFVHAFKGYWEINAYARKKGTQIINITPASMIDAFKRQKI